MKCKYKWNYFNTDDCLFTYEMVAKEDNMELVISRNNSVVATLPFSSLSSLKEWTLLLDGLSDDADIILYDLNGRAVLKTVTHQGTVNLSALPQGLYAVEITSRKPAITGSQLIRL